MKNKSINRRDFIKRCITGTLAMGSVSYKGLLTKRNSRRYDARGLPTRILGETGIHVPLIAIGGGSRFCRVKNPEESVEILNYALDHGFYYWDTAHDYVFNNVVSEERFGLVLKDRRDEVFLATKVGDRTYDGAMRHLEESLKRLNTTHLDLYQIHLVRSVDDVEKIGAKNGVLKALQKLKDERLTSLIGFSGHLSAEAMAAMVERYDFDTMLIALNHYAEGKENFEKHVIPAAARKKMGIMVMKVVRPREAMEDITPEELIRYALSLEHAHVAVIGIDSLEVLKENINLVKNFTKMNQQEMQKIAAHLKPFFEGKAFEWMHPSYTDGIPV